MIPPLEYLAARPRLAGWIAFSTFILALSWVDQWPEPPIVQAVFFAVLVAAYHLWARRWEKRNRPTRVMTPEGPGTRRGSEIRLDWYGRWIAHDAFGLDKVQGLEPGQPGFEQEPKRLYSFDDHAYLRSLERPKSKWQ